MTDLTQSFHDAVGDGRIADIRRYIEQGVDVNATDDHALTPVIMGYGKPDVVRLLVEHGADIDYAGFGEGTALSLAAYSGDIPFLECCLDLGASVNLQLPGSGETALHDAAVQAQTAAAQRLLDGGADPNIHTFANKRSDMFGGGARVWAETPLHFAAAYGDAEMIRAMLQAGADRRAENAHGERPIAYAGRHFRDGEILELLSLA